MYYKDGEVMNLNHIAEVVKIGEKISKKDYLSLMKRTYKFLDKDQVASIIQLIYKMLLAKENGEKMTIATRDWNQDGSRRF